MTITSDIQSLSPGSMVELFVLDMTKLPGGMPVYFHAGTNELSQSVIWQGNSYLPYPVEASGFDISAKGTLPRPRIQIANINGLLSALVVANADLVGCVVTRKRTFVKYLDAANFISGTNALADPNQHLTDDVWFVDRKLSENKYLIEWELSSAFDLQGIRLPYRQVIQNTCPWQYRSAECGWVGGNYDVNDSPCAQGSDFCSKHLSSCKVRFGTNNLPFGGFPGAVQYGK